MLEISNLTVYHKDKNIIENINFSLDASEHITIIGKSGSGKSVLVRALMSLNNREDFSYDSDSKINFLGNNILKMSACELENLRGKVISMVFQDPFLSLNPAHDVLKQIREMFIIHKIKDSPIEVKINEILRDVGLDILINKKYKIFPHQLSGGQRQRLNIAMAAILKPKILIADEITTALDPKNQEMVIKLLNLLRQKYKVAVIFVTHDLDLAYKFDDRVIIMDNGRIVADLANIRAGLILKNKFLSSLFAANKFRIVKSRVSDDVLITVKNLSISYQSKGFFKHVQRDIINNLSFSLYRGETLGILGSSGSGKSTIARAILRLQESSGDISYENILISGLEYKKMKLLRRDLQIIYQDPAASLNPKMTIYEIIREGMQAHNINNHDEIINDLLVEVGLNSSFLLRYARQMSGGEKQKVAIARALCLMPKFIILDEPTASLDKFSQREIILLLMKLQRKYHLSYIFISHDVNLVKKISHRFISLT
jgi:microcin C transport system ATP-binding protein